MMPYLSGGEKEGIFMCAFVYKHACRLVRGIVTRTKFSLALP